MITLVVAEDHHVVRAGICALLNQEPNFTILCEVADGAQVQKATQQHQPTLLLLDAHMPNHNVLRTTKSLVEAMPGLKIVILSAYRRQEYVVGLLDVGAVGYVLKDDPPADLIQAIYSVAQGGRWLSPRVLDVLLQSAQRDATKDAQPLTARECETLILMASGYRNAQIAQSLTVTEQTVKNYVGRIMDKLGVETRVEAVLWAIKHQLVALDE